MADTLAERIARYAYRYWMRHGMTEWPTVARAANALRLRVSTIDECSGDGPYQLTGYNFHDVVVGNLYVEAQTRAVDVAWCAYWLPYSGGCCCGEHTIP